MRFSIKQAGCGSERVGCFSGFIKSPSSVIETPTSAIVTQGGSVVHLTADVLAWVFPNPQLLWLPLSNSIHLENGVKAQGEGVAKFVALPDHVTCVTLHNASEVTQPGHFEADKLPLWTKHGKKMITAERYMELMAIFKPDMILALADSRATLNESDKRVAKSVERTSNMLDTCVHRYKASEELQNSALIGVIVGGNQHKKLEDSMKHILKHKEYLRGITLAGITDGTEESLKVPLEKIEEILKRVDETIPKDFVRIIEGCWNPAVILAAIEHGWDMFDGSYPLKLTNAGQALALNFNMDRNSDELCILNLNDKRYNEDFKPILEGCNCLACKKHSRAYIRHLLNTREMLSSVLLSIHNLHHFDQFFHHVRLHIAAKTFNIFKKHITSQYDLYKMTELNGMEKVDEVTEVISVQNGEGKEPVPVKKKIRVSNHEIVQSVVSGNGHV